MIVRNTIVVWSCLLLVFLGLELPAVFHRAPWLPLTGLVRLIETDWRPFVVLVVIFFGWLLVHMGEGFVP